MSDFEPELPSPVELLTEELDRARHALARLEEWATRLAEPGTELADALRSRIGAGAELVESYRRPLAQLIGTTTATVEVVTRHLHPSALPAELDADLMEACHNLAEDTEGAVAVVAMLDACLADAGATITRRPAGDTSTADRVAALIASKAAATHRHLTVARRVHARALTYARACHDRPLTRPRPPTRRRCRVRLPRSTAHASTEDPSPRRRQGAEVGTSTSPGGHDRESEGAST